MADANHRNQSGGFSNIPRRDSVPHPLLYMTRALLCMTRESVSAEVTAAKLNSKFLEYSTSGNSISSVDQFWFRTNVKVAAKPISV